MRMARANFCQNFFGCAGFEVRSRDKIEPADLIVLCSSDPEYLPFAQEVLSQTKAPVIVAGNPKDHIEALKAAGVKDFVYVGVNAVEVLSKWQEALS